MAAALLSQAAGSSGGGNGGVSKASGAGLSAPGGTSPGTRPTTGATPELTGERSFRRGQLASGDEAKALYSAGITESRAWLAQHPDSPEGLLWLAANLGGDALAHGKLFALRKVPEIERVMLRLDEVAPAFDHAAGARGLARLYQKAPGLISVGSNKKARHFYERALSLGPSYVANEALAADFFYDVGEVTRARELARAAASRPEIRVDSPDSREWREIVERVLGQPWTAAR